MDEAIVEIVASIRSDLARLKVQFESRTIGGCRDLAQAPSTAWTIMPCLTPVVASEGDDDEAADDDEPFSCGGSARQEDTHANIEVPCVEVDVEGQSNVFHEVQTDVATRGLIRDLADSPSVALTALIAQLFKGVRLATYASTEDSALAIRPTPYERQRRKPIEGLDQEVWSRIEARKDCLCRFKTASDPVDRDPAVWGAHGVARRAGGGDPESLREDRKDRIAARRAGRGRRDRRAVRLRHRSALDAGRRLTSRFTPRSSCRRCSKRWESMIRALQP